MKIAEIEIMKNLLNSIPGIIFWKNKKLEYLGVNDHFLKIAGISNLNQLTNKKNKFPLSKELNSFFEKHDKEIITFQPHNPFQVGRIGRYGIGKMAPYSLGRKVYMETKHTTEDLIWIKTEDIDENHMYPQRRFCSIM